MSAPDPSQPQTPLPVLEAGRSVVSCAAATCGLLWAGGIRWPRAQVGTRLHFADGTSGRVFRVTEVPATPVAPCLLAVTFRLVLLRGDAHLAFERESILNTPLFVGFPGFVSKLWIAADERGRYRGLYDWDGEDRAVRYARSLWRILALGSVPGSIAYRVVPGLRVSDLLSGRVSAGSARSEESWWVPARDASPQPGPLTRAPEPAHARDR